MPKLDVVQVKVADVKEQVWPLLQANHNEMTLWDNVMLRPDWQMYVSMQEQGMYKAFTAYVDGSIVGHCGFFVAPNPHSKDSGVCAVQDLMWLHPDYRRGMTGVRFIRRVDELLGAQGAVKITRQSSVKRDYGRLLQRMGYVPTETNYTRRLG